MQLPDNRKQIEIKLITHIQLMSEIHHHSKLFKFCFKCLHFLENNSTVIINEKKLYRLNNKMMWVGEKETIFIQNLFDDRCEWFYSHNSSLFGINVFFLISFSKNNNHHYYYWHNSKTVSFKNWKKKIFKWRLCWQN